MKKILIGTAMILAGSSGAQAQDFKPYVGVGVGVFGIDAKDTTTAFSQKVTALGGYAKFGVDMYEYFGMELRLGTVDSTGKQTYPAGSTLAGTVIATPVTVDMSTNYFKSYLLKVQNAVSSDFRFYALVGATTAKPLFKVDVPGIALFSPMKSKTGFSYGGGGDFSINDQFSVGGEWMQYWTNVKVGATRATMVNLWGAVGTFTMKF